MVQNQWFVSLKPMTMYKYPALEVGFWNKERSRFC